MTAIAQLKKSVDVIALEQKVKAMYRDVCMSANSHYLDALAVVDDPTPAIRELDTVTERT